MTGSIRFDYDICKPAVNSISFVACARDAITILFTPARALISFVENGTHLLLRPKRASFCPSQYTFVRGLSHTVWRLSVSNPQECKRTLPQRLSVLKELVMHICSPLQNELIANAFTCLVREAAQPSLWKTSSRCSETLAMGTEGSRGTGQLRQFETR